MPALTRCLNSRAALPELREDRGAVAVGGFVRQLDGCIEIVHAHDVQHRAENFLARDGHVVLHLIDNRRADIKTIRRIGDFHAAAVGEDFRAFLLAAVDEVQRRDRDAAR